MPGFGLDGERVALRDFTPHDLDAVQAYAGDPEVSRYMIWGPNDPAATQAFLTEAILQARAVPRTAFDVAVTLLGSGELVGGARIAILDSAHRRGDIGYVLRREVWGQGLGTEIARLLCRFGFEELQLHRIEATCDPRNVASRRVLEKAGMRPEGVRRDDFFVRGSWRDSLLLAVLESDGSGRLRGAR